MRKVKKDITTKEIIETITIDIAKYILNLNISNIEFIDKELKRIEKREADLVAICEIDNKKSILHIEIQNNNDSNMIYRMLRYYTEIKQLHKNLPVYQYVIYIGKNRLSMENILNCDNINYSYNLLDLAKIDCEKFIEIDTPDALVLAILCDFKGRDEKEVIKYIITRIRELIKDDEYTLSKYMLALETLSENRNLQDKIKEVEAMIREVKLENLPSFQLIAEKNLEKGRIEGRIEGLEQGKKVIVINAIKKGLDDKLIQEISGFSLDEIQKLRKSVNESK
ncbi:MAG: hypothetical protein DSY40_00675 [Nautilia sp.]|nr:MAG: hypothetical protein DSY40_00675 [Nautilia sp.]